MIQIVKEDLKEFLKNNNPILKTQQRSRTGKHNAFNEDINKIALSSNDDTRIQSIGSVETFVYGMNKDLVFEKEEIKCNNIMKQYKNV